MQRLDWGLDGALKGAKDFAAGLKSAPLPESTIDWTFLTKSSMYSGLFESKNFSWRSTVTAFSLAFFKSAALSLAISPF